MTLPNVSLKGAKFSTDFNGWFLVDNSTTSMGIFWESFGIPAKIGAQKKSFTLNVKEVLKEVGMVWYIFF